MIQIQIPQIFEANDYHEFGALVDNLNALKIPFTKGGGKFVKYFELNGPIYAAVIYQGTKRDAEKWLRETHPNLWRQHINYGEDDA